jgi:hypothetical protein
MRTFKISFALVVLFLIASTYTVNAQVADTVRYQPIPDYPVTYPVYKPKPQPSYYPFFNNGVTGANEVVNRIAGPRYISIRDYHGAKQFSYAELLTEHLSMLNKKYEWGFGSVNLDTVVYILNHSREVYEPFGKSQYTVFYFDRNGIPMPRSIGSGNEPDKLIVFNNVAFIHCPTGGLMEPAVPTMSYPVRQKIDKKDPVQETEFNWFPDWLKNLLLILAGIFLVALLLTVLFWLLRGLFSGTWSWPYWSHILIFTPTPPAPPVTTVARVPMILHLHVTVHINTREPIDPSLHTMD